MVKLRRFRLAPPAQT